MQIFLVHIYMWVFATNGCLLILKNKFNLFWNKKVHRLYAISKWLLLAIPVIFLAWFINRYSINLVMREDFNLVDEFIKIKTTGAVDWFKLVAFSNEHIILFPKIIIFIFAYFSDYNNRIILVATFLLLTGIYYLFVRFTVGKRIVEFGYVDVLYSIVVGFCLFSCCQYENLLWNFQIAWFVIEFCIVFGFVILGKYLDTNEKKYIYVAIICGVVSSFSSLHGLLIWPCYLVILAVYQFAGHKFDKTIWYYMFQAITLVFVLYFYNYYEVEYQREGRAQSIWQMLQYFLQMQGSVISISDNVNYRAFFGVAEILFLLFLFVCLWKKDRIKQNILTLGVLVFSGVVALMISYGRANWNDLVSRYATYPLLSIVAIFAILRQFCSLKNWKGILSIGCFCLFSVFYVATEINQRNLFYKWKNEVEVRAEVLKHYKLASTDILMLLAFPNFQTRNEGIYRIEMIEQNCLTLFCNYM